MRTIIVFLSALSFTLSAHAAQDCQPDHLSPEDLAIMASVRAPQPVTQALAASTPILHGVAAHRGQLSAEDMAIIQSVQPVGARIVLCPTDQAVPN
jgi:hypothetical protein